MLSPTRKVIAVACAIIWLALLLHQGAFAATIDLDAERARLAAGEAEAVYQALLAVEDDNAGDPEFDYLLGLAALESGHPDKATFVFERVLTVEPEFFGARLDMARAYFALGNYDLARAEFEALKELDPPPAAQRTIKSYVDAIDRREQRTRVNYFVEAGLGYSTNINTATSQGTVTIPNFATIALDADSVALEDGFARGAAGLQVTHDHTDQTTLVGKASVEYKENLSTDGFETTDLTLGAGAVHRRGADQFQFDILGKFRQLDWDDYQHVVGLGAEWRRDWSERTQTSLGLAHVRSRYRRAADESNDSNLTVAGLTVSRVLDDAGDTTVSLRGIFGVDAERNTRIDGSRELFGAILGAQHKLRSDVELFGRAAVTWSVYDRANTLFNIRRHDIQMDFGAGARWRPAPGWLVRPEFKLRRNMTDIPLNEYERLEVGLTVRRDF